MKNKLNILITGAGAPGIRGTVYALRNNPDKIDVKVISTDINDNPVGKFFSDKFYLLPPPESDSYCENLLEIYRRENIDIVVPQTTREISLLSNRLDYLSSQGTKILVSPDNAISRSNNKYELLRIFKELGLPHPSFVHTSSEKEICNAVELLGYPNKKVIVKPPVSNGMRGFRILSEEGLDLEGFLKLKPNGEIISLDDLLKILRRGTNWPDLLVTQYLPGEEYSVDVFKGKVASVAIPRLRKEIRSGISFNNSLQSDENMINWSLDVAQYIGLRFCFGFQYKMDNNGVPMILECNPRVQGTMIASFFSGVNIIWLGVKECLGETIQEIPTINYNVSFKRYWGGIAILDQETHEI